MSQDFDSVQERVETIASKIHDLKANGEASNISWSNSWNPEDFDVENRSMVMGVLGQGRGDAPLVSCENCVEEEMPFDECMIVLGHLYGACCNCYFKGQSHKCSFRRGGPAKREFAETGSQEKRAAKGKNVQKEPASSSSSMPVSARSDAGDPKFQTIALRQESQKLSQEINQMKDDMEQRIENNRIASGSRHATMEDLTNAADAIEKMVEGLALAQEEGFGESTENLPQILKQIQKLVKIERETNTMVLACIQALRATCGLLVEAETQGRL